MTGFVASVMGALFGGSSGEPVDWKEKALHEEQRIRWHRLEEAQTNGWKNWIPPYMNTLDPAGTPYDYPRVWIWRPEWDYPSEVEPEQVASADERQRAPVETVGAIDADTRQAHLTRIPKSP